MEMKFYRCKHCGQIVAIVKETGVNIKCCGEDMEEIIAGSVDASKEKHVPIYDIKNNVLTVRVGSIDHPMIEEHYIEWIAIETTNGNQRKKLNPNDIPEAKFYIGENDKVLNVYAYCNLHGLWKTK